MYRKLSIFVPALLAAMLPAVLAAGADPEVTIRSDVTLVRVDAQVLDRSRRAITGLRAQDFNLYDEGRQLQIRNFAREEMPVDILFLLDVSGSMEPHIQTLANAAHNALSVLAEQDRVAIMVFDRSTRVRMPFRSNPPGTAPEFDNVLRQERFNGGTDITRGMLDAATYMGKNGRRDARRAIVILTDDETERDRDEPRVERALAANNTVLMALLATPMSPMGGRGGYPGGGYPGRYPRRGGMGGGLPGIILGGGGWPGGGGRYPGGGYPGGGGGYPGGGGGYPGGGGPVIVGGRTHTAGTAEIARQSGGDSMSIDSASALEDTLQGIRQRYALYFYLPEGAKPGQERNIRVELTADALRRHPEADVRYRQSYLAPGAMDAATGAPDAEPVNVSEQSIPAGQQAPQAGAPGNNSNGDNTRDDGGFARRRRPSVDDRGSGARGPLTPSDDSKGGWRRAGQDQPDSPSSSPSTSASPAATAPDTPTTAPQTTTPAQPEQPQKGGWRRIKPGEQP